MTDQTTQPSTFYKRLHNVHNVLQNIFTPFSVEETGAVTEIAVSEEVNRHADFHHIFE